MTDAIKTCSMELIDSLNSLHDAVIALSYVSSTIVEGKFDTIEELEDVHSNVTKSFQVLSSSIQDRFDLLYTHTRRASALLSSAIVSSCINPGDDAAS